MFLGRKRELAFLEKLYNSNELHCVCLNGAAGVGKTALLQEFARRKRKAYFCVRSCTSNANKAAFCAELAAQGIVNSKACAEWQESLLAVAKKAQGEKMLLLLDDGKSSYYIIFSRKGFTDRALGYAARTRNVRLISLFYLK